jgi:hypothetical protein
MDGAEVALLRNQQVCATSRDPPPGLGRARGPAHVGPRAGELLSAYHTPTQPSALARTVLVREPGNSHAQVTYRDRFRAGS